MKGQVGQRDWALLSSALEDSKLLLGQLNGNRSNLARLSAILPLVAEMALQVMECMQQWAGTLTGEKDRVASQLRKQQKLHVSTPLRGPGVTHGQAASKPSSR